MEKVVWRSDHSNPFHKSFSTPLFPFFKAIIFILFFFFLTPFQLLLFFLFSFLSPLLLNFPLTTLSKSHLLKWWWYNIEASRHCLEGNLNHSTLPIDFSNKSCQYVYKINIFIPRSLDSVDHNLTSKFYPCPVNLRR